LEYLYREGASEGEDVPKVSLAGSEPVGRGRHPDCRVELRIQTEIPICYKQ